MSAAGLVEPLYLGLRLNLVQAVFRRASVDGRVTVAIAEHAHHARTSLQHKVGAAPHDDARLLVGQLLHYLALGKEEHVVVRQSPARLRAVALRQYALQPERRYGLLVAPYVVFVDAAALCRHLYKFAVVEPYAESRRQHLAQHVAAAAKLAGYGNHHVGRRCGSLAFGLLRVAQHAVEHTAERCEEVNYRPHEQRRSHRALAHAVYAAYEEHREHAGKDDVAHVEAQFDVAEVAAYAPCQHPDEELARHHCHVGLNLERYAARQNDASGEHAEQLHGIGLGLKPRQRRHGYVDKRAETERNGYLYEIHAKVGAQL